LNQVEHTVVMYVYSNLLHVLIAVRWLLTYGARVTPRDQ